MKLIIAIAALLVSSAAMAGDTGSSWHTGVTCQPARRDHRCVEYEANLELHHVGEEYCGLVNETSAKHSPTVWFNGRRDERGLLVRFIDSFQYGEDAFGWARIEIHGNHLAWIVLLSPAGGRIADERRFNRASPQASSTPDGASSCSELEYASSGLAVHLGAMSDAATAAGP